MAGNIELKERQTLPDGSGDKDVPSVAGPASGRSATDELRPIFTSALFWIGIPAILAALYMFLIAADQYRVQAKFVVRGNSNPVGGEIGGNYGAIIALNTSQDTYIAASLIGDGGVISNVSHDADLHKIFGRPGQDLLARLPEDASGDDVAAYWSRMVKADVDPISGIVTVETHAFTPEDAALLAMRSIKAAEDRLNELHTVYLRQSATLATDRVEKAGARLAAAREEIKKFRNEHSVIDMAVGADSAFDILADLRRQRIEARAQLAVVRQETSPSIPTARLLERRLQALDKQIATLQTELTGKAGGDIASISAAIEIYDTLNLHENVAADFLARAIQAQDAANQRLARRDIYLETFVAPLAPEDSRLPHRWSVISLVVLIAFGVWSSLRLLYASTMEHEA